MDEKRELTSVDLRALVGELGDLGGPSVRKAYLYPDADLVRLRLRDPEHGRRELLFEVGKYKRFTVADPDHVADAPDRPPNFARMLRNRLQGARLVGMEQYEFDRIVRMDFERADDRTGIVVELFGDGNLAVVDETDTVIDCLRTVRLKSREVVPGRPYEYPESRVDPLSIDRDEFVSHVRASSTDVVRTLATQLNFGGLWGEELCTRAGVEKALPVDDATDSQLERVYDVIVNLRERLHAGDLDPVIYEADDRPVDVAPVRLAEREHLEPIARDRFNDAVDEYFHRLSQDPDTPEQSTAATGPDFDEEIEEYERIIEHQERALDDFAADAEAVRERAELLYARYDLVDEAISAVRQARERGHDWEEIAETLDSEAAAGIPAAEAIERIDGSTGTLSLRLDGTTVDLDPREGVEKNADRLYREAKEIEAKREGAVEAIERTKADLEEARDRKAAWSAEDEPAPDVDKPTDWLSRSSIPIRHPEDWYERFRWFHTSDGFLVLGGRDAKQNEELVEKYLERGDRFFHTQARGGPVTVLKATGPSESTRQVTFPDRTIDEAAQFAVSYSSVWEDGRFAGDVYEVGAEQVSKSAESGEYLETGAFAIRGDRTYHRNTAVGVSIGVTCEPATRVIGGPTPPIEAQTAYAVTLEPGEFARPDAAQRIYRKFREAFADTSFVRTVASTDEIQRCLPPGGSRIVGETVDAEI